MGGVLGWKMVVTEFEEKTEVTTELEIIVYT